MKKDCYNVIGVMSGTSLDGVDLAHVEFTISENKWQFEILEAETISYSDKWVEELKNAVNFSLEKLNEINEEYTILLSNIINDFIKKNNLNDIDAVCSHGHTVLHQPHNGITLQIGNLAKISNLTNQTIVCNFRVQDVKLGGQGAPLVPIGDRILFSDYEFCLNLGGFSNISFEENNYRLAFDISPVNTVLNYYAEQLGLRFDDRGLIASKGQINNELLLELNNLDFYKKSYPKSLGIEYVNSVVIPTIEKYKISIEDKLCTFIEHIADQINVVLQSRCGNMLITGGGAYNDFLIKKISEKLQNIKISIPNSKIIEFKEALIFALLGVLKLRDEVNVLCSVTGSSVDHSSGEVFSKN